MKIPLNWIICPWSCQNILPQLGRSRIIPKFMHPIQALENVTVGLVHLYEFMLLNLYEFCLLMKNSDRFIIEWKFSTISCWKCMKNKYIFHLYDKNKLAPTIYIPYFTYFFKISLCYDIFYRLIDFVLHVNL